MGKAFLYYPVSFLPRKIGSHTSKQPNLLTYLFPKNCTGNGSREPETVQPYLDLLVDELLQLSDKSVYDSYSKAPFLFKCEMLSYVLDYPGVGKVFNVLGSGSYRACAWCEIQDKYCMSYKLV